MTEFALIDPTPPRITERDMFDALMTRYDKTVSNGDWTGPRFMRAEHVRDGLAMRYTRIADFIAVDTHSHSRGDWLDPNREHQPAPVFHGHEVKVSRSDWLAELRDPSKADAFKRYMHFWWLVVPDRSIVRDDLPDDWGLIVGVKNSLRIVKRAPLRDPEPMPNSLVGALMRAAIKTEQHINGRASNG